MAASRGRRPTSRGMPQGHRLPTIEVGHRISVCLPGNPSRSPALAIQGYQI